MSTVMELVVAGMTCDHCVRSVTEAVRGVPGAVDAEVDVDLGAGTVTVRGVAVDRDAVVSAIADAGYEPQG